MFDLLKNKLSNFIQGVKEGVKGAIAAEPQKEAEAKPAPAVSAVKAKAEKAKAKTVPSRPAGATMPEKPTKPVAAPSVAKEAARVPAKPPVEKPVKIPAKMPAVKGDREEPMEMEEIQAKPSLRTRLEGFILPSVTIKEADVRASLDSLELQLIEADVAMPVAQEITSELRSRIVGQNVKYSDLDAFVRRSILDSIRDVMSQERIDIAAFVKECIAAGKKPVRILFVGPNGHGKTTTIAKIAHLLKKNGLSCVLSASDTFRAAAIEQTAEHGRRLGVPVVKHHYGSDPAAVAFDAIKYAESHGIDVVLIDTAGRQETSRNLIEQMKKIERVAAPHLRLFVGEGIVGHAIIQQVSEFNAAIRLDGVILTKVDCDTKGGSVISIRKATGVPVLYLAVGQGYEDLVPFNEDYVLSKLMS